MSITVEPVKPHIGGIVRVSHDHLLDDETIETVRRELETRGVLVFPQIAVSDQLQLAFTDRLGERVNFTRQVPGSDADTADVYKITLDRKLNSEPDYVLGTFFWHIDGITIDQPLPKATVLSARKLSDSGGATEFANLYAAWDLLPEEDKREYENLRVIHCVEAAVRPVHGHPSEERRARYKAMAAVMEQPLVWTHEDGRKSLLLGTHADGIVGMPGAHGRALLARLQQWAAQPDFVYTHKWQPGDLVIWNNQGLMHRVVPYTDEGRVMHRTTIAGTEKPGVPANAANVESIYQVA
ncbi:TauD/TfdA family dioxygenase [Novosphingobium sp. AP12]|uniref:TauD/TfdA dioxygenase family protein n=1 Tax=Novosphingobium sp. AP12 TaxID=1144305 RepID=UPI00027223B2|nr:TauD/TfdA family dioxygenase [Novosphingobium sp. AP12]EJL32034.1 putative taurine catabolism dioxygenase [Novosphingobium sp. AP12]